MAAMQYVDADFAILYKEKAAKADQRLLTLVYGDAVEVLESDAKWTKVRAHTRGDGQPIGFVKGKLPLRDTGLLKFTMVDVQQGDGMVFETPSGKVVLVDGGDNKLFARHLAARFWHKNTSADQPLPVDALIITHGDADHFAGLNEIVKSETNDERRKRLFIHPKRVYHNGLVKGPGKLKETASLGRNLKDAQGRLQIFELYDDPRAARGTRANEPFNEWFESLDHWETRGPIDFQRVAHGMDPNELFGFLKEEGLDIAIQGPFPDTVTHPDTGQPSPALPFFNEPESSSIIHLEQGKSTKKSPSASHTINGHSIALRLTFGNIRFNLTGDLNKESLQRMKESLTPADLEAEIVKAPHHGSSDFDLETLKSMKPLVALVSSGDESGDKEYIHPRAPLMAALGRIMREDMGIVFVTELAAFFSTRDYCHQRSVLAKYFGDRPNDTFTGKDLKKMFSDQGFATGPFSFYGFERTNFGLVHLRTDGQRVLIFTHSGRENVNEAYRFEVKKLANGERKVTFIKKIDTV